MPTSNDHELSQSGAMDDLRGWRFCWLKITGYSRRFEATSRAFRSEGNRPAATTAEAKKLIAQSLPHVALIDFHLRGENSYQLIAQARDSGIPVIMLSGSLEFPMPISLEGIALLEKPASEAQILEHLRPIVENDEDSTWPKQSSAAACRSWVSRRDPTTQIDLLGRRIRTDLLLLARQPDLRTREGYSFQFSLSKERVRPVISGCGDRLERALLSRDTSPYHEQLVTKRRAHRPRF